MTIFNHFSIFIYFTLFITSLPIVKRFRVLYDFTAIYIQKFICEIIIIKASRMD